MYFYYFSSINQTQLKNIDILIRLNGINMTPVDMINNSYETGLSH